MLLPGIKQHFASVINKVSIFDSLRLSPMAGFVLAETQSSLYAYTTCSSQYCFFLSICQSAEANACKPQILSESIHI